MDQRSSALLFTLVLSLACGEWLVSPTIAQRDEAEAPPPSQAPPAAFLTGTTQMSAMVDGLETSLEGSSDSGFTLVFHNASDRPQVARLDVDCMQQTGSPIARMTPPPSLVHSERVVVSVAAGATVRRDLEADVAPPEPGGDRGPFDVFTTTSFRLRRVGADAEVEPLAVLRWSETPTLGEVAEAG